MEVYSFFPYSTREFGEGPQFKTPNSRVHKGSDVRGEPVCRPLWICGITRDHNLVEWCRGVNYLFSPRKHRSWSSLWGVSSSCTRSHGLFPPSLHPRSTSPTYLSCPRWFFDRRGYLLCRDPVQTPRIAPPPHDRPPPHP